MTKTKRDKIAKMNTSAIQTILGSLTSPETERPSPEFPLGGQVHITGIGHVAVTDLRAELARRETAVPPMLPQLESESK